MWDWDAIDDGMELVFERDLDTWPWNAARVAPEADGAWSACLWNSDDDREVDLGRYRTKPRAKAAAGLAMAGVARLDTDDWFLFGEDDFGGVTLMKREVTIARVAAGASLDPLTR